MSETEPPDGSSTPEGPGSPAAPEPPPEAAPGSAGAQQAEGSTESAAAQPAEPARESEFSEFFQTDDLPTASSRPSRHRAAMDNSPFLERLLAPVTAVAVVIIVIVLLIWINGGSSGTKPSRDAVAAGSGASASTPLPIPHRRTAPPAAPTKATSPAAPAPAVSHKHRGAAPTAATRPRRRARTAMAPLTVLNNSRRTGLAHAVAGEAAHKGWRISQVGNLQGIVPETTVYYAPGDHDAAKHLAHDFASVQRVEPNTAGHIHGSALTLVVTRSWVL